MRDRQQESLVRIIQHVLRSNALVGKVTVIGVRLKSIQSDISVSWAFPFVLIDKSSPLWEILSSKDCKRRFNELCETIKYRPCSGKAIT